MLSQQLIQELQTIFKAEYGQDLDLATVAEIGAVLVAYFNLLAEIDHQEKSN